MYLMKPSWFWIIGGLIYLRKIYKMIYFAEMKSSDDYLYLGLNKNFIFFCVWTFVHLLIWMTSTQSQRNHNDIVVLPKSLDGWEEWMHCWIGLVGIRGKQCLLIWQSGYAKMNNFGFRGNPLTIQQKKTF